MGLGAIVVACLGVAIVSIACGDDDNAAGAEPDAGDGGDANAPAAPQPTRLSRASHGGAVQISEDDSILVTANRDKGTVSVFDVTYRVDGAPTLTRKAEIELCGEPWQVALAPNGERAFVVCRKEQKLVRVDNLRSSPVKGPDVAVGSEPTGVALTPKAGSAWVANWMDGTVTAIDTNTMAIKATIDLNAALVATNVLGEGLAARPALAHPRSVAITNNKDDNEDDESVFVTEYFSQQKEALAPNGVNADIARQGFVYRISTKDRSVKTIPLPPIADIGLHDHNDQPAGCFPNQVQAINIEGSFAYALSICASPKGPLGDYAGPAKPACTGADQAAADATCPGAAAGSCVGSGTPFTGTCKGNCTTDAQCGLVGGKCDLATNTCKENFQDVKTMQTPAVSVIDIGANKVIASVALNAEFDKLFDSLNLPDTSARRYPLHVVDVGFVPGTLNAYMTANGVDAVYRVDFNATYETKAIDAVGSAGRPFIPLDLGTLDPSKQGKLPIGIAMTHKARPDASDKRFAFVLNEGTRNVTVIDLKTDDIAGIADQPAVASTADMPTDAAESARMEGKRLFETGLGRWSLNGQGWGACSTCHWEGYSDQITWFHRRGSRQSPSIDQTINSKDPSDYRAMNWQASSDELADNENGALRVVLGGVGAIVKNFDLNTSARIPFDRYGHSGLNGSITAAADPNSPSTMVGEVCVLDDWKKIDAYEKNLLTPRKPSNLDPAKVEAGKAAFMEGKCQGCHGGPKWTLSRVFYTPDANTGSPPGPPNVPPTNVNQALITTSWSGAVTAAGFPATLLPVTNANAAKQTMRFSPGPGATASDFDALTCVLRNVGTFNVAEPGVGVAELRRDMAKAAQGGDELKGGLGYNVPSLLGMAVGAPYFHAGNARTLEGLLSSAFAAHTAALTPGFLGSDTAKRDALVQFLLSIDEDTEVIPLPSLGPSGGDFCALP